MTPDIVMAGLVPAIHVFALLPIHVVDARHKPALGLDPRGYDEGKSAVFA
jgi:hypothetical protein